jgi:hypothetical protein
MTPSNDHAERQPSEATLDCLGCGQTHRINGGWILTVHADSVGYECPTCKTTVDSRSGGTVLTDQSDGALRLGHRN